MRQQSRFRRRSLQTTVISRDAVVVSWSSFDSDDPYEIVYSNIEFLNALFAGHLTSDEVSVDALHSYYVDYYLGEMNNGGFSQFVYNSGWKDSINNWTFNGMAAMGALQHLDVFENGRHLVHRLGSEKLEEFFASEYWGENAIRDELNAINDQFFQICESEDLIVLNAAWLRQLPNLVVLSESDLQHELSRRIDSVPDREQRIAKARENEPRYLKLIRLLCERARLTLSQITAGDPTREYNGEKVMAWHFNTDQGHFHMIEVNGKGLNDKALLFRGHSTTDVVVELETSPCMAFTPLELAERKKEWNDWMVEEREGLEEFLAQQFPGKSEVELDIATVFKYALWKQERDGTCESDLS